jgi:RNA polymerase sigma-70 factor (ECF subfamily)
MCLPIGAGDIDRPLATEAALAEDVALAAAARGDQRRFEEIYHRHYPGVAGYVFRRTGDAALTDELANDVFAAAWRGLGQYRGAAPLRLWLLRIATNAVNRRVRRLAKERARRARLAESGGRGPAASAGGAAGSDHGAHSDELARALDLMLRLSRGHQTVLALVCVEGLSIEDAAGVLGVRPGTVKSRLSRARAALRTRIEHEETHR